jgi:phosphoribosylformylglycinamidine synthase
MSKPRVLILRAPGTNCDQETQFAFERAGAFTDRIHINRLREEPELFHRYQILVIPGGFMHGDDVAAGKILACQLAHFFHDTFRRFRDADKLILGICNGFQALIKAGLIVIPDEDGPLVTLTNNDSGRLEDRWVHLHVSPGNCPFLKGYDHLYMPVAHGEGKLLFRESWILKGLEQSGQAVLHYVDEHGQPGPYPINPNGSMGDVAGLCDATGRVLGLMPHPERHVLPMQHPHWTRLPSRDEGDGLRLFKNAVEYFN